MKNSCCDDYDPNSLSVEQALERIEQDLQAIGAKEQVTIRSALGRILAEDVLSKINVPPHENSAMDGYAVRGADLEGKVQLSMVGTSFAGQPYMGTVEAGQCARIFTGAVIPNGTDTVIMQEHVERDGDVITIGTGHKTGQNVRPLGEDMRLGETVLKAGKRLSPADIGLLASNL